MTDSQTDDVSNGWTFCYFIPALKSNLLCDYLQKVGALISHPTHEGCHVGQIVRDSVLGINDASILEKTPRKGKCFSRR